MSQLETAPLSGEQSTIPLKMTYFMLVKTTNLWLQMKPKERFEYIDAHIRPLVNKRTAVNLRYFDTEAFSGRVTDVLLWEATDLQEYQALVEELRETLFWGTYFEIVDIIPGIENAYASHYQVEPL